MTDLRAALASWNPDAPRTRECTAAGCNGGRVYSDYFDDSIVNCPHCVRGRVPDGADTLLSVVEGLVREARAEGLREAARELALRHAERVDAGETSDYGLAARVCRRLAGDTP